VKTGASAKPLLITISAFLALTGCLFSPDADPDPTEPPLYYSPPDSAWKVLANLQMAYVNRDHDHYMQCFRDDFEFHLLEQDWDDYNGDGIIDTYWGLDKEDEFHQAMFNGVELIELTFTGTQEYPWMGDPSGISYCLPRTFDLKVYTSIGGSGGVTGYRASGSAQFICRPDEDGEWYIWQWFDESEI